MSFSGRVRLLVCLAFLSPVVAAAQSPAGRPAALEKQTLRVEGELQGLNPGFLKVVCPEGEAWLVKVEAKPEDITYQASAHASWLQPGMFVQFQAKLDRRGKAVEPVSQLTVFTPTDDAGLGAFLQPDPSVGGGERFGDKAEVKPTAAPEATLFTVAGRLTGVDDGRFRVAAANAVVEAALADDASILVELNNYALARQGDQVTVNGWYVQKGRGWANRLLVRAVQPLSNLKNRKAERGVLSPNVRRSAVDALEDVSAGDRSLNNEASLVGGAKDLGAPSCEEENPE